MKKHRYNLTAALLALIFVLAYGSSLLTAFADGTDDIVLAEGQPPLTVGMVKRLISFFEWTLDGKFTDEQRVEFARECTADWKNNDQKSIETMVGLIKVSAQLAAASEEQRQQAHPQAQKMLLDALQQQPDDQTSRLLLNVYRQGQQKTPTARDSNEPAGSSSVPGELIGAWRAGSVSSTTFVNRNTGAYADPSGTQVRYRFFPDGRYEFAVLTTQSMYNCTTKLLTYKTGVVSFQGGTLTFIPKTGKFTSEDNCNRQYNYEKPAKLDRETYNWRVERDEYGVKMCLQNATTNGCAYQDKQ